MPDFLLPDLGEGITEGELVEWRVAAGDEVAQDQVLLVVGTDKATVEIPSPSAGRVEEILVAAGARVPVGTPLLRLAGSPVDPTPTAPPLPAASAAPAPPAPARPVSGPRVPALPSVRRAARERGLELGQVLGTGPGGRVRASDLLAGSRRVTLRGAARVMAERVARGHRLVPQVTVVLEADAEPLERAAAPGAASILGLVCLAALAGLVEDPLLNASFDDRSLEIVYHGGVGLGIAVQAEQGLLVANIPGAERLPPSRLQEELGRVVESARQGRLSAAELTGSTFTVSSGGRLGGLLATPLVDWPQVAILGVHAIQDRAVVREGRVEAGRVLNLSLSFDHRIIDGMRASRFLYRLVERLGRPELLLQSLPGGGPIGTAGVGA